MADDTKGLPDVDLQPVLDDLKTQDKDLQPDQQTQTADADTTDTQDLDLGQFKNPKDMLKSYKEIQGAFTKVTQDIKTKDTEIADLKRERELSGERPELQVSQQQKDNFDERFVENPQVAVAEQVNLQLIANVLAKKQREKPQEFQERYAYVQMLGQTKFPNLVKTPDGVEELFIEADKVRTEQAITNSHRSFKLLFGTDPTEENIQKFKQAMGITETNDQTQQQTTDIGNAYMPDTTSSTRTGADQDQKPNFDQKIQKAVDDGDVDAALDNVFGKALSE